MSGDTYTQVPADSVGDKIDGSSVTIPGVAPDGLGGSTTETAVNRQRMVIADSAEGGDREGKIAEVTGERGRGRLKIEAAGTIEILREILLVLERIEIRLRVATE